MDGHGVGRVGPHGRQLDERVRRGDGLGERERRALHVGRGRVSATSGTPDGIIDGIARQVGDCVHGWVSDRAQPMPQVVQLDFPKPVNASEVRLAFDTDLTPMRVKERMPGRLVKVYRIEGRVRGVWRTLAEESENFLRHRVHRFRETEITALRVMVTATWGDSSARIFELRVY